MLRSDYIPRINRDCPLYMDLWKKKNYTNTNKIDIHQPLFMVHCGSVADILKLQKVKGDLMKLKLIISGENNAVWKQTSQSQKAMKALKMQFLGSSFGRWQWVQQHSQSQVAGQPRECVRTCWLLQPGSWRDSLTAVTGSTNWIEVTVAYVTRHSLNYKCNAPHTHTHTTVQNFRMSMRVLILSILLWIHFKEMTG